MQAIFGFILIVAVYVSYRVSSNKGYSGILFAIGAFLFPLLAIIVFALPDKAQVAKNAYIQNAFEESMKKQQREIEKMSTRIRELENQQSEKSETKGETMPKVHERPVYTTETGRTVNFNVESDGDLADILSLLGHAKECYREKNYFLALQWFERAARAEHLESQMYCGEMYYHGQGCEVNYEKALYWYEKAAQQGQPVAQNNCAIMYKEGSGCTINLEKALYWKEQLAEQGDTDAQFEVGMMYELGQGCEINLEKARLWYEKSAAQGNANAQKLLDGMQ